MGGIGLRGGRAIDRHIDHLRRLDPVGARRKGIGKAAPLPHPEVDRQHEAGAGAGTLEYGIEGLDAEMGGGEGGGGGPVGGGGGGGTRWGRGGGGGGCRGGR